MGPVGPRWAPCWPHEPYFQGYVLPSLLNISLILQVIIAAQGHNISSWILVTIGLGHNFSDDTSHNLISCFMIMMYHQIDICKYTSVKFDSNSKLSSQENVIQNINADIFCSASMC